MIVGFGTCLGPCVWAGRAEIRTVTFFMTCGARRVNMKGCFFGGVAKCCCVFEGVSFVVVVGIPYKLLQDRMRGCVLEANWKWYRRVFKQLVYC